MKDAKTILYEHADRNGDGFMAGQVKWVVEAMEEYAAQFNVNESIVRDSQTKKKIEQDFLELFNRIKKSFCEKRNMKFSPTRVVSKPSQLHARMKDYSMDELGKVICGAFSDNFHIENKWKYVSTEYITRTQTIEKYLV